MAPRRRALRDPSEASGADRGPTAGRAGGVTASGAGIWADTDAPFGVPLRAYGEALQPRQILRASSWSTPMLRCDTLTSLPLRSDAPGRAAAARPHGHSVAARISRPFGLPPTPR